MKNPSDFVGSVLGESEKNAKAIVKAVERKGLVIWEAYMLSTTLSQKLKAFQGKIVPFFARISGRDCGNATQC